MTDFDYSAESLPDDPNDLLQLRQLIVSLAKVQLKEAELTVQLVEASDERKLYEQKFIPELMSKLGMKVITTDSGLCIEMIEEVRSSFPKDPEKQARAIAWLEATGNEGMLKHEFKVQYGRGEKEFADMFQKLINEHDVSEHATITQGTTIHSGTLKAFAKKEITKGTSFPLEDFGTFVQKFAKIKRTKK